MTKNKCQIKGCKNSTPFDRNTGIPKKLCDMHFRELMPKKPKVKKPKPAVKKPYKPKVKKPTKPKIETFVLRGHTLTINYTAKVKHIQVNRLTRAVIYNEETRTTSGEYAKYVLDIKQGIDTVGSVIYKNKKDREKDFAKLQNLLSKL